MLELTEQQKNENDFCECGGILNFYCEDIEDNKSIDKCEECGKTYYRFM